MRGQEHQRSCKREIELPISIAHPAEEKNSRAVSGTGADERRKKKMRTRPSQADG